MRLNKPIVVAVIGFSILIFALLSANFIFPSLKKILIEKETALVDGGRALETWKKIPFPFKMKIYFFNVTNPDDAQMGAKPILREMGPYIYNEYREREILSMDDDNDTIKYIQRKRIFFSSEESGCRSENDVVTIVNFAVVSMAQKVYKISPMALPMINDALPYLYPGIKNIFITDTVRNILFEGLILSCESEEVDMICEGLRDKRPHTIRLAENGRDFLLSLFHHINDTEDGPYEIGRGLKDKIKGGILSFKDEHKFTIWNGDRCNSIKGTDLTVNPNLWEVPKKIDFFIPDFCRYFSAYFDKERMYQGLRMYVFKSNGLFENEKECFCLDEADRAKDLPICGPRGTMDIQVCSGSFIKLSQPHFFNGEKSLLELCRGLEPNRHKHGTYIFIEPKTGLTLLGKIRIQMNVFLQRFDGVTVLQNVSDGFFPFIWIENHAQVPEEIINEVKSNFDKLKIFDVLKYVMISLGILLLGVSIVLAMIKDKILWSCSKNNAVSTISNEQFQKFVDMYYLTQNKPTWRISE